VRTNKKKKNALYSRGSFSEKGTGRGKGKGREGGGKVGTREVSECATVRKDE
jgi:hypothetical protein